MRGFFFVSKKKTKRFIWLAASVLIVCAWHFLAQNLAIPLLGNQARLVPIYYVETKEKKVSFSFDACWGAEFTPALLRELNENNIRTTFFLTGFWVEKFPELVRTIAEHGHEIGNHTYSHPHLNSLGEEGIKEELNRVGRMIKEITGQEPVLFRPPFGEYNNTIITTVEKLGYRAIQWSVDSLDWQEHGKDPLVTRVTQLLHPGAIILFHNNGLYTAEALPEIIQYVKRQGYTIVPISELLFKDNYQVDPHTGAQIKEK